MILKICEITMGARPIDGSSSSSTSGRAISARPIASICCSPPDSVPPTWVRRSASRGNVSNTQSSCSRCSALRREFPPVATHFEVLGDGHPGEHAAALRRLDQAVGDPAVRLDPGDVLALEPHRARRQRPQTRDGAHHRGLAGTVGAQQRHQLALAHRQRNTVQRFDSAVVHDDVADLEQDRPGRRRRFRRLSRVRHRALPGRRR